jgi:hypothetical protein
MKKLLNMHPSDDQLDLYLLGHLSLEHEQLIEDHYLDCEICLDGLSDATDFIGVLKIIRATRPHLVDHHSARLSSMAALQIIGVRRIQLRGFRQPNAIARAAAAVLLGAFLCDTPSSLRDSPPHSVVSIEQRTLVSLRPPLEIERPLRRLQRPTLIRRSHAHRIFQAPPGPLVAVAAITLETPIDLSIPVNWIAESNFLLIVPKLEPPRVPPFRARTRWLRRVLVAVGKRFQPPPW